MGLVIFHPRAWKTLFAILSLAGTTVNIGQAMNPKSGEFVTPEPGLYLFLVTCCTLDMKKCLVSIRKNGKDVANLFDQDGDTNKVRFPNETIFVTIHMPVILNCGKTYSQNNLFKKIYNHGPCCFFSFLF